MKRKLFIFFGLVAVLFIGGLSIVSGALSIDRSPSGSDWPRSLSPLRLQDSQFKRAIIHIHSNYSHDACDKKPMKNGRKDEECFKDFLRSFCELSTDIVFVTEHADLLSDHEFLNGFQTGPSDEKILENGVQTGVVRTCANGHRVHFYLGAENELMPIGLVKHPEPGANSDLKKIYQGTSQEAINSFRNAGAIVGTAHTEHKSKTIEYLKSVQLDFLEIYNTHAEFLKFREEKQYLKLMGLFSDISAFSQNSSVESDLIFLRIKTENQIALERWSQLALTQHITGTAGTDAHQNSFPAIMTDGERVDSYRRMQRWFSNYVDVEDPKDRLSVLRAIRDGKLLVVFEIFGTPTHFNFEVRTDAGIVKMGEEKRNGGKRYQVHLDLPKLQLGDNHLISDAKLKGRILKATDKGWVLVAESESSSVDFESDEPGVYRAEVRVIPNYLKKYYSGAFEPNEKEPVWIYSNPIWIK